MDGEPGRRRVMILELDLQFTKQSYIKKIQLNMSKNAGEKCGKLSISSILNPKGTLLLKKLIPIEDT